MIKKINLNFENFTNFNYDFDTIKNIFNFLINDNSVYKKSCIADLKIDELETDFVFCNDEFIHNINKQYRGKDCSTDVISFALFCDDEIKLNVNNVNLGEIIISIDTAKRQAKENAHTLEYEVYYLITHGILHLLGFDHLTEEEYNFMVDVQKTVMDKLNYV